MGNLNPCFSATNLEIKISDGDGEGNRPMQKAPGPPESTTNQGEAPSVKQPTPIFILNPTQIFTTIADANGRWHCPVPGCPLAGKGYQRERHLANHVKSKHGDSIRINLTYVSPPSNISTPQRTGKRQPAPTDTASSTTNPNTTSFNSSNTNPNAPQCDGAVKAFQEQAHKYENFQIIQQHRNAIISGLEDREKLMRALRESGATITSLSANAPDTSNN